MKYFFCITLFFCLTTTVVHAASISVSFPPKEEVGIRVPVDIVIDPQGENINAIALSLSYPHELLTFDGYSDSYSTIALWVERPTDNHAVVHFSGVIPGGIERIYDPNHSDKYAVQVVRLFFIPQTSGMATLVPSDALVLKNDGMGTPVVVTTQQGTMDIQQRAQSPTVDTTKQEPFTVEIIPRSRLGQTPRLAVFDSNSPQHSIEHYEVRIRHGSFTTGTSPFPLPSSPFSYMLTVRAFDYKGTYQEQQIEVPGKYNQTAVSIGILSVLLVLMLIFRRKK